MTMMVILNWNKTCGEKHCVVRKCNGLRSCSFPLEDELPSPWNTAAPWFMQSKLSNCFPGQRSSAAAHSPTVLSTHTQRSGHTNWGDRGCRVSQKPSYWVKNTYSYPLSSPPTPLLSSPPEEGWGYTLLILHYTPAPHSFYTEPGKRTEPPTSHPYSDEERDVGLIDREMYVSLIERCREERDVGLIDKEMKREM